MLSIDDIYDYSKFLDEICDCCEINDIALEAISSESGRGQFELCLKHTDDVLKLADGLIFLKNIIRFISRKNGFARLLWPNLSLTGLEMGSTFISASSTRTRTTFLIMALRKVQMRCSQVSVV